MFSIGEFARHGSVSVRMLRHYDAIGLLRPARTDPGSGYRFYTADQFARLNRVIALKDLGFTLDEVRSVLDERVDPVELGGMLRSRRTELRERIVADTVRLAQVEARLALIESEGTMQTHDVVLKALPAVRVAELSGTATGFEPSAITPVIRPLCEELGARLARANIAPTGRLTCYYEPRPDGTVRVHAAIPVRLEPWDGLEVDIVDLPEIPCAATIVHRGAMDGVLASWQALGRWIEENGYHPGGPAAREYYLETGADESAWVTELQEPVVSGRPHPAG